MGECDAAPQLTTFSRPLRIGRLSGGTLQVDYDDEDDDEDYEDLEGKHRPFPHPSR